MRKLRSTSVHRERTFIGNMTASLSVSFAPSKPATSSHFTFGVSLNMAPDSAPRNFAVSASTSSSGLHQLIPYRQGYFVFPPDPTPFAAAVLESLAAVGFARCSFSFSARSRYSLTFFLIICFDFSFFSSTHVSWEGPEAGHLTAIMKYSRDC